MTPADWALVYRVAALLFVLLAWYAIFVAVIFLFLEALRGKHS
jgi:hypothetical protein